MALADNGNSAVPAGDVGVQLYSIDEAASRLGIGRTALYELIGDKKLQTVKIGKRRLVSNHSLTNLIIALSA